MKRLPPEGSLFFINTELFEQLQPQLIFLLGWQRVRQALPQHPLPNPHSHSHSKHRVRFQNGFGFTDEIGAIPIANQRAVCVGGTATEFFTRLAEGKTSFTPTSPSQFSLPLSLSLKTSGAFPKRVRIYR